MAQEISIHEAFNRRLSRTPIDTEGAHGTAAAGDPKLISQ